MEWSGGKNSAALRFGLSMGDGIGTNRLERNWRPGELCVAAAGPFLVPGPILFSA